MLPRDSLVCLVLNGEITNFASVVYRDAKELAGTDDNDFRPRIGLCLHDRAYEVSELLSYVGEGPCCQMIQVSNNFFAYEPVLKVLQKKDCIAMADKILDPTSQPKAPQYLKGLNIEKLLPKTLNKSQKEAMVLAFSQEFAVIQGPPGTGKSFVGEEIIDIIYNQTDQKILIECYTNHALDQFLEGLLDRGMTGIVRIGGRSRSSKLEALNIRTLADNLKTKSVNGAVQRRRAAELYGKRDEARSRATNLARSLEYQQFMRWEDISSFLKSYFPDDYNELLTKDTTDHDGFQLVGEDNRAITRTYKWDKWSTGKMIPKNLQKTLGVSKKANSIWNLDIFDRSKKMREWAYELNREDRMLLADLMVDLRSIEADLKALHKVIQHFIYNIDLLHLYFTNFLRISLIICKFHYFS